MEYIQVIGTVVTVLLIPFVIQLIKSKTISSVVAGWLSIVLSVAAGLIAGFISGIPNSPETWTMFIFAVIGGVQAAYMLFKAVGVTNAWLDALLNVGSNKELNSEDIENDKKQLENDSK